jgi:small subunit ribosomal protein S4
MSRYTGPKGRINRALGINIYESAGAVRAFERRDYRPGMHGKRPAKTSSYGLALKEKKKIKHYYGLHEAQLRRMLALASKSPENTGEQLLVLCERRLDNVVRRAGFAKTRPQARQGVNHGHFRVNGRTVDIPSFLVKPGDVVSVAPRPAIAAFYRGILSSATAVVPDWIFVEAEPLRFAINSLPGAADVSLPVDVYSVIELLTR